MSIFPLPVFEADADSRHREALTDEEIYEQLKPPTSIVVKFGAMKLIGEYPYDGDAKPGCGSKLVARTHRGTELVEMLTTTCPNTGCNKAISRQEMLEYIDNSGGKDFPFYTNGKILRVATVDDLNAQSALTDKRAEYVRECKALISEHNLDMKLVEAEPILGGELLTFYYMSEDRVDFRELVRQLASRFKTRIEMRQIGARDEARLVADYERCGQHCCCKNFLKVLKPVSMRSAKVQKATLDPLKISGRCGRLMCCLRYEDQTYDDLRKNLPNRKKRVGTNFGPGIVIDTKILVQLVLVRLEHNHEEIAVPVEELMSPDECPQPDEHGIVRPLLDEAADDPLRGLSTEQAEERTDDRKRGRRRGRGKGKRSKTDQQDAYRQRAETDDAPSADAPAAPPAASPDAGVGESSVTSPGESSETRSDETDEPGSGKRRRRRGRRSRGGRGRAAGTGSSGQAGDQSGDQSGDQTGDQTDSQSDHQSGDHATGRSAAPDHASPAEPGRKKKKRRRRRKPGASSGASSGASPKSSQDPGGTDSGESSRSDASNRPGPKKKRRRRRGRGRGRGGSGSGPDNAGEDRDA